MCRYILNTKPFEKLQFLERFGVYLVFKPLKKHLTKLNKTHLLFPRNRRKRGITAIYETMLMNGSCAREREYLDF
jgi:hypothetical protein